MDFAYLKQHVGEALSKAFGINNTFTLPNIVDAFNLQGLTEVAIAQPGDPVEYLGQWLLKHLDTKDNEGEVPLLNFLNIVFLFTNFRLEGIRGFKGYCKTSTRKRSRR